MAALNESIKKKMLTFQETEITEYFIYKKLAGWMKDVKNKKVLDDIAEEELNHYNFWKEHSGEEIKPDRLKLWLYTFFSKVFGITFGIKLMENGEEKAEASYEEISVYIPEAKKIQWEEEEHENDLIGLIDEERLKYVGSMVLGLNDALVELTGALAGFTLALQNLKLIAITGLITGIAASLSMAASEYLSTKTEGETKNPVKASLYTGFAYILAVVILIAPYLIFKNIYFCLVVTIFNAIILILFFSFYISVAKDLSFKKRFFEMAPLTLGISILTFGIGFLVKLFM
jgi:vacuolar iron transporter family protein